jgi:parallel beta helix pectate lyase-like protein
MSAGSTTLTSPSGSFASSDVGKYIQLIGAGPGAISHADGSMAHGSAALASASAAFKSGDVGKGIIVLRAGANGSNLVTTIRSYTSPTSVTLNAPAGAAIADANYSYGAMTLEATIQSVQSSTGITLSVPANATISSATFAYGTDNHLAFQAAVDAAGQAGGGSVSVPAPPTCPAQAACGYVIKASDQMTAKAPGAVKIRYNNVSLIGDTPQTNLFCRGAWATYTNSVAWPGQTAAVRGFCLAIGDNGGPNGRAGTSVSNITIANLHLYGMTNGNTYNNDFSFPPVPRDADGWDTTHKAIYLWEDGPGFSNITINSVVIQDFKAENIFSGGSPLTGMVIENCTMKNFNGNGISMLAADLQVLNNTITNGSNAAVENSTEGVGATALIRQLYQNNTISYIAREGIVVVGVKPGIPAGSVQILDNYFDTIAQIHASGAQAAIYIATQSNGTAPSNVTIAGNTCHDCNSLGVLGTSGTTQVTHNNFIVDRYPCNNFLSFAVPMTNFTIASNTGYATADARAKGLTMAAVYMINPGYQSGAAIWNNVVIQGNAWTFPGTPQYQFVTTSGVGWNFVGLHNLIWKGDSCGGCTHSDVDHGVVDLSQRRMIEPYGPVLYVMNNAAPVTATVDASKEQDGSQVQIVNAGSQSITFASDANMSLSAPVTLPGGVNSSTIFYFNAELGKFTLPLKPGGP